MSNNSVKKNLQISGFSPNIIRELSGIFPSFNKAFKELISNAYDADATLVTIEIPESFETIAVEDNGIGMTPDEYYNDYIRIGGISHDQKDDLTAGGRRPIGRKGIGFLAVARYCELIEIYSHTNRKIKHKRKIFINDPQRKRKKKVFQLVDSQFEEILSSVITINAIKCGKKKLTPKNYVHDGFNINFDEKNWQKLNHQEVVIDYTIDFSQIDIEAFIDYKYILNLGDTTNLERLMDFSCVQALPTKHNNKPSFTRVKLHLRDFVQRELQSPRRRGRVQNISSTSGFNQFIWKLSRSIPVDYELSSENLRELDLGRLDFTISETPFSVRLTSENGINQEIKRPLVDNELLNDFRTKTVAKHPLEINSDGLIARGYLIGFSQPIFPAEVRGIAIRVRGVEIGQPTFLGVEDSLPSRFRPYLKNIMGEVIIDKGMDALLTIIPGRGGFYEESEDFKKLRKELIGDGAIEFGALGIVLEKLYESNSVRSSAMRLCNEAKRRRNALLDVSNAITSLSVGSRYDQQFHRLFRRSDITSDGLCKSSEYIFRLPQTIGEYSIKLNNLNDSDFLLDEETKIIWIDQIVSKWHNSLNILGREFTISLRKGKPIDPICEIDLEKDIIYINWLHPTRSMMGDVTFIKSALSWRIAHLAVENDIDSMMNLAHRLLSFH